MQKSDNSLKLESAPSFTNHQDANLTLDSDVRGAPSAQVNSFVNVVDRAGRQPLVSLPSKPEILASSENHWSLPSQALLNQLPASFPLQLIAGGVIFCLALGGWACFGQIDEVGHARGQLVPEGDVYKIHPVELGKVTRIAVKEGQAVKAGELLAVLDPQIAVGEAERLRQMVVADQLQLDQMQTLAGRLLLEARSWGRIADADFKGQVAAIAEAQTRAATLRESLAQLKADVAAHQTRVERLKPLASDSTVPREHLFEAEQALRDRQSALTKSRGALEQAVAEISRLQAGLTQKQAEGDKNQIETQQQAQRLQVEMTRLKARITETQNLFANAEIKRKQRFLFTPVAGTVFTLNVHNIGEVVQPGQTIAEVAPQEAPLILRARLPNQEAGFVKVGMPVQVKLDAYPYQEYGVLPGKVISISPNAKPDVHSDPVYQVDVRLERNAIRANQQTVQFKAGQVATADIVIRRRRIIDILLNPFKQIPGGINL